MKLKVCRVCGTRNIEILEEDDYGDFTNTKYRCPNCNQIITTTVSYKFDIFEPDYWKGKKMNEKIQEKEINLFLIKRAFRSYHEYNKNPKIPASTMLVNRLFHLIELLIRYLEQMEENK